jgi:hypothetical protein
MRLRQATIIEGGRMQARASFQFPEVELKVVDDQPIVVIDEGGILLELEFFDDCTLEHFKEKVASLRL